MSDLEDHAWVQAAKTGSSVAYSQLVNFHQAGLIAFLRRISVNSAEAEDIAQETFLFAWHELSQFDLDRSFRAWLFGIAWRKCRESRRSWLRRLRRETTAIEISLNPIRCSPEVKLDLWTAINRLSSEERASVLLCLMAGFSHEEAAQVMDATARKVKALVASARHKLSEMMGDRDDARC
jgi:RNA polymerase sigma-70 factor (ECF subfamily)